MRNQRTSHRVRLSIGMMLALFAAVGTFWLLELLNREGEEMQAAAKLTEPDYIVERFSFVRLSKEGKPAYIVSGDKLTHRPIDDSSEIDKPVVRKITPDLPPMDIHAKTARVDDSNSRVKLAGNVTADRAGTETVKSFSMKTEAMTIYPDEDRMETDQAFTATSGNAKLTGTGLKVNNATSQAEVNQRMRLVYPPAPQR
ncbi:LPS export ABC transporter periplasmic protein LptC [Pseudoduganella sp. RAF53_2]|uniref:LPS export ABC transporter periplasmic protein LptC n=1 Tax=unclassified Pseudoduganella TaxID=2637179 RepID=UPI003F956C75